MANSRLPFRLTANHKSGFVNETHYWEAEGFTKLHKATGFVGAIGGHRAG